MPPDDPSGGIFLITSKGLVIEVVSGTFQSTGLVETSLTAIPMPGPEGVGVMVTGRGKMIPVVSPASLIV